MFGSMGQNAKQNQDHQEAFSAGSNKMDQKQMKWAQEQREARKIRSFGSSLRCLDQYAQAHSVLQADGFEQSMFGQLGCGDAKIREMAQKQQYAAASAH